jgi:hypothetical protein
MGAANAFGDDAVGATTSDDDAPATTSEANRELSPTIAGEAASVAATDLAAAMAAAGRAIAAAEEALAEPFAASTTAAAAAFADAAFADAAAVDAPTIDWPDTDARTDAPMPRQTAPAPDAAATAWAAGPDAPPAAATHAIAPASDEAEEFAVGDTNDVHLAADTAAAVCAEHASAAARSTAIAGAKHFADGITAAEAVATCAADMTAAAADADEAAVATVEPAAAAAMPDDDHEMRDDDFAVSTSGALADATAAIADFIAPRAAAIAVDVDALLQHSDALGDSAAASAADGEDLLSALAPTTATLAEVAAATTNAAEPSSLACNFGPVPTGAAMALDGFAASDAAAAAPSPATDAATAAADDGVAWADAPPTTTAAATDAVDAAAAEVSEGVASTDVVPVLATTEAADTTVTASATARSAALPGATTNAVGEGTLADAVRDLQAEVQRVLLPWREGAPPALANALAPIQAQLERHGEWLTQHTELLRALAATPPPTGTAPAATAPAAPAPALAAAPPAATLPPAAATPLAAAAAWRGPLAFACLGSAWSVVLWWKTGDLALAAGVLVAANTLWALAVARATPGR